MAPGTQQEEENWDDDFEFGSSAGSPVPGRRGDMTPPNLSPRTTARCSLVHESTGNGHRTPPKSKNRWSSGSIENWDDEDETINLKSLGSGPPQQPVTPKTQSNQRNRTPTNTRKFSEDGAALWDEEDEVSLTKTTGLMLPSKSCTPPASTSNGPYQINGKTSTPVDLPYFSQSNTLTSNPPSAFPSSTKKADHHGSGTESSITNTDIMYSSESSILAQSDISASTSASQSSSFFGRLGRRLSKAGSGAPSRNGTLSSSTTEEMPNSSFPSAIFSPPASSNSIVPNSVNMLGSSPSRSRAGFNFGGSMLKRSGSLSKSSHSGNLVASSTKVNGSKKNKSSGNVPSPGSGLGLGMSIPSVRSGPNTAPAAFNARRYTERVVDVPYSSPVQYVPQTHGHSHSVAGLPRNLTPGWGAPPSPTRNGKAKQLSGLDGVEMLTSLSSRNKLQSQITTSKSFTSPAEGSRPTHQQSASLSGTFFSSMRKRSNPLQAASKVPNSAMNGAPPVPSPSSTLPRKGLPPTKSETKLDEAVRRTEDPPQPQTSAQSQTQAQRQRRTHRRNLSTGAMITSVIDEVSSDGTVSNKLSAGAMRDRPPAQKSGLSQSTTASEIRRAGTSTPPPRTSISSDGVSSPPPVSPIVFGRDSEDSGTGGRRSSESAFFLPPMSILSPAFPTPAIRADMGTNGRRNGDWSSSSSPGDKPVASLLPPIELCPPSPPVAQPIEPSQPSTLGRKEGHLTYTPDPYEDKTPMAAARRRVHHLQIGTGEIVPVALLSKSPQLDKPKYEISQGGLTPSISAPVSLSSAGSSKTLAPKTSSVNKRLEGANGRTSPGISASLGRLAGASTAGRIEDQPGSTSSSGLARRNSLSGGVVSATLPTASSMVGGLKIPARISAKQDALKRDLSAVREFALSIDELKRLQFSYELTLCEVKRLCRPSRSPPPESRPKQWYRIRTASPIPQFRPPQPPPQRAVEGTSQPSTPVSPTFENPPAKTDKRRWHYIRTPESPKEEYIDESSFIPAERKETMTAAVAELDTHYSIWWECADLLIELGGAAPPVVAGTAVRSPTMTALRKPGLSGFDDQSTPRAKGRHATLPKYGPHPDGSITDLSKIASPDSSELSAGRRGSTGQQDLNARQLQLLKEMLSTPNPNDLSSSVDFRSLYAMESQALSPVINNPASTVRNSFGMTADDEGVREPQVATEREKKRNRRISLAGKPGVREILAGLKWTKEKAKQRYKQTPPTPDANSRKSVDFEGDRSRTSVDQSNPRAPLEESTGRSECGAAQSGDNLSVTTPAQPAAPPSPYKRNRRRSLASIFKFGNTSGAQVEDRTEKSITHSRSRVDLTSPLGYSSNYSSNYRTDDSTGPDVDSDWDQLNSPSDMPGRYSASQHTRSSAQDQPFAPNRGRTAPVGIPISNNSRHRSSRNASASRNTFTSASASSASLVSSSVYGSAASQSSLHESLGGRGMGNGNEEDRRRLKKPPSKQLRRPPSAGARKSRPPSSQRSSPGKNISSTPPVVTSPILDRPHYSTRSVSGHSPNIPEPFNHPYHSAPTRSAPLNGSSASSAANLSQPRLALTPENIIPLLVYAREVKLKLADCLVELKSLETDLLMSKVEGKYLDNDGTVEFSPEYSEC